MLEMEVAKMPAPPASWQIDAKLPQQLLGWVIVVGNDDGALL